MIKRYTRIFLAVAAVFWLGGALAEEHGHMHHAFAKDVDAFHSLFAPIWHAPPGPARARDACAKAGEIERLAKGIQSADATRLVAAVAVLKSKCKDGATEVDAALFDVHEALHGVIDARPAAAVR